MISDEAFHRHLLSLAPDLPEAPILVAFSGGCDSVVLLHLLRSGTLSDLITAAHLDHAIRPESAEDADWVRRRCAAWKVPLLEHRLTTAPGNEEDARDRRYDFLKSSAREIGARYILTAHHADDQAETVLFRILRGTGIAGLSGIPARTPDGLLRPLLPFWREEIERYAGLAGLEWRVDSTNRSLNYSRNRIRHDLLPRIERDLFPDARRKLNALAEIAQENETGWSRIVEEMWASSVQPTPTGFVLARGRLRNYDPALSVRLLRHVLHDLGIVLSRAGTRRTLQFITDAPSGRHLQLPNGLRVLLEFEEARLERPRESPVDEPLMIAGPSGKGTARLGGRSYSVKWAVGAEQTLPHTSRWQIEIDPANGPFALRARKPGDRMRTGGGTKTLKKLFLEQRVPISERATLPVLVDRSSEVLWAAGISSARLAVSEAEDGRLIVSIADD